MPRYKYSNLFPRIHPLKKSTDVDVAIVRFNLPQRLKQPLNNVYAYVLEQNYLTTEKIEKSLAFLERAYSGAPLLEQVRKFTTKHCRNGCFENAPELNFDGVYYFWVFIVSAFLYLNEYIKTDDQNDLMCAENCFHDSTLYKREYINIQPRRRGGNASASTRNKKKMAVYRVWLAHKQEFRALNDMNTYNKLKRICEQESVLFHYKPSSFTRNGKGNILTQFAQMASDAIN